MPKTLLVDAASLIYRAFFSSPEDLKDPQGRTINAAYGFLNMLARLVFDRDPAFLACAADLDWRPQWRVDLIDTYKAHRTEATRNEQAAHAEDELEHQVPLIFEILQLCGVAVVGAPDFEAEDVIGALVPRALGKVEIVSGDRDLFQLVKDPDVVVLYPKRGVSELITVDETYISNKYGIPGRAYGDYALLRGDPSDGLPGVPGIGEKTASALISRYGNIAAVVEAALSGDGTGPLGKVRSSIDYIDKAGRVVLITPDVPIGEVDLTRPRKVEDESVLEIARQNGLQSPVRRLIAALCGETN